MKIFDTADARRRDRVTLWNEVTNETFGPIRITPLNGEGFSGRITRHRSAGVSLASVESAPAAVEGASHPWHKPLTGHFILLNETGASSVRQEGRQVLLGTGEFTVIRADAPYEISFSMPNHMIVSHLPATLRRIDWAALAGRPQAGVEHPLLFALLRQWSTASAVASEDTGTFARLVRDVLAVTLPASAGPTSAGVVEDWASRIESHVTGRLGDPDLNVRSVATALGASPRYGQLLMARNGLTLSGYILEQRLERAAELLLADRRLSVSAVSERAGFNDVSYFCRAFKSKYGSSATAWRAAAS